jgi:hypothetical protein
MTLLDKLGKLFYGLHHQLMAGHNRSGMNQKSVQDFGTLGHSSKSDIRYWQRASFRQELQTKWANFSDQRLGDESGS